MGEELDSTVLEYFQPYGTLYGYERYLAFICENIMRRTTFL